MERKEKRKERGRKRVQRGEDVKRVEVKGSGDQDKMEDSSSVALGNCGMEKGGGEGDVRCNVLTLCAKMPDGIRFTTVSPIA